MKEYVIFISLYSTYSLNHLRYNKYISRIYFLPHRVDSIIYFFRFWHFVTNLVLSESSKSASENKKTKRFLPSFCIFLLITFTYQLSHHLTLSDSYLSSYLYKFPSQKKESICLVDRTSFEWKYKRNVLCSYITSTDTAYVKKETV